MKQALLNNIDFEAMPADNYENYRFENLPETYGKLQSKYPKAYTGLGIMATRSQRRIDETTILWPRTSKS